ncbi:MAG: hypothetical protein CL793_06410 [Chloroflexi bacterium]|nr:hypothetical protein [Chloroflexota bacterium]
MSIETVKASAEIQLEALKVTLLPLQEEWAESHTRYWQGRQNPQELPRNGVSGTVDPDLARRPMPSWEDFGVTLPDSIPYSVRCDEFVCEGCHLGHDDLVTGFFVLVLFTWGSNPEIRWIKRSKYEGGAWTDEDWVSEQMGPIV